MVGRALRTASGMPERSPKRADFGLLVQRCQGLLWLATHSDGHVAALGRARVTVTMRRLGPSDAEAYVQLRSAMLSAEPLAFLSARDDIASQVVPFLRA